MTRLYQAEKISNSAELENFVHFLTENASDIAEGDADRNCLQFRNVLCVSKLVTQANEFSPGGRSEALINTNSLGQN